MTSTDLPRVKLLEFQVRTTLDFYQNQVKLSRCLIYKVQSAVFEDFSELFEALYRSRWQLIYYIRFISVCQELFSFLFKLFRPALPLTEAAYLVYQTEKRLSRSFFNFLFASSLTVSIWDLYSIPPFFTFVNCFLPYFRFLWLVVLFAFCYNKSL